MRWFVLSIFLFCGSVHATNSYILYDMNHNVVIESQNADSKQSVASLTKLVTAMVCIDLGNCDRYLLERMLVKSDNNAAEAIAAKTGRAKFIKKMNDRVQSLNLKDTHFVDPSGLGVFNTSTAAEFVSIVVEAEKYPLIKSISSSTTIKKKKVTLYNTNILLLNDVVGIILSKTGWTNAAGRCLALVTQTGDDAQLRKYAIVILGEESIQSRIALAKRLINVTK